MANTKRNNTYVVEALVLLVCLLLLAALSLSLFAFARIKGAHTAAEQQALLLAENTAERFAASPSAVSSYTKDDYSVVVDVQPQVQSTGVLYLATISVFHEDALLYTLNTARYESGSQRTNTGQQEE